MITISNPQTYDKKFVIEDYVNKMKSLSNSLEVINAHSTPLVRALILEDACWFFAELGDFTASKRLLQQARDGLSDISNSYERKQFQIKIKNLEDMEHQQGQLLDENDDFSDIALTNYWIFHNDGVCYYSTQEDFPLNDGGGFREDKVHPDLITGLISAVSSFTSYVTSSDTGEKEELHSIIITSKKYYIFRSGEISILGEFYKICPEHYMRKVLKDTLADYFTTHPESFNSLNLVKNNLKK